MENRLVSIKSASRGKEKRENLKIFLLLWLQPVRPRRTNQINLFFASNAQVALKVAMMKNGHLGQRGFFGHLKFDFSAHQRRKTATGVADDKHKAG